MKIEVNGKSQTVEAEGDTPLLWVLRDFLGLRGTKFGCGKGLCGACTVQIDGRATRSCTLPLQAVGDGKITTIEGLSEAVDHPLQLAWQEYNVPQCGYCQSGQLMSASALLAENPQPTDSEIDRAMAGNLCRCGTYPRIRAAIRQVASAGSEES